MVCCTTSVQAEGPAVHVGPVAADLGCSTKTLACKHFSKQLNQVHFRLTLQLIFHLTQIDTPWLKGWRWLERQKRPLISARRPQTLLKGAPCDSVARSVSMYKPDLLGMSWE